MRNGIAALAAVIGLMASLAFAVPWSRNLPTAEAQQLPGMCSGRTDANVNVKANGTSVQRGGPGGPATVITYRLDISSDESGVPSGVLAIGPGPNRVLVTDFCRLWQHLPGQPVGECGNEEDIGATNIHAVGIATLPDGTEVLIRTDLRENEEGQFFRFRYRELGQHGDEEEGDGCGGGDGCGDGGGTGHEGGGGCEDESWVRVPEEGWLPLSHLNVQ